jgi:hypothetical protein
MSWVNVCLTRTSSTVRLLNMLHYSYEFTALIQTENSQDTSTLDAQLVRMLLTDMNNSWVYVLLGISPASEV